MRLNGRISILLFSITLAGCETKIIDPSDSVVAESSYCSAVTSYSSGTTTVTGTAQFAKGVLNASGLNVTSPTMQPIRYAEVQVKNATGSIIQCTETDNSGGFTFLVPQGGTYTVYVNSRGYNAKVRASVLNNPSENVVYSISTAFAASAASVNVGTITASATGNIEGGAFNIFDQIVKANAYLYTQANDCSTHISGCLNFSIAPKVQAYWTPGFNPATLFGSSNSLSFYVPGTSKLYILGGSDTSKNLENVKTNDTDHYDDSVIVHEYGHFIEDIYSNTDSPGGSHDANAIIDPRLAWGEGWADFFSATVPGNPTYQDTYGNDQGSSGNYFNCNLESNDCSKDVPTLSGEGNFREFAISRALWDAMDAGLEGGAGGSENIQAPFREFWHIFTSSFRTGGGPFRDYGLFTFLHDNLAGRTDLATIFDDNDKRQLANRSNYAGDFPQPNKACGVSIQARRVGTSYSSEDGSYGTSNQFDSNDFYLVNHPGGTMTVNLSYNSGSRDLDLWIYKEGYSFGNYPSTGTLAVSASDPSGGPSSAEAISVSAPAGYYLVNVNYYTGGTGTPWPALTYDLTVGGASCP